MHPGELQSIDGRGSCLLLTVDPEFALLRDEARRELILAPHGGGSALLLRAHLELGRALGVAGVARPLRMETPGPRLVLDDAPGVPLSTLLRPDLPLVRATAIALSLARVVAGLHQAGVTHRGLRPDAFLVDGTAVTLVDLETATRAKRAGESAVSRVPRADLLPWIAPELTGRMNHGNDRRADLYALGAILYALYSGSAPFAEGDAVAMIHRHIATRPAPLATVRADVPTALDAMVQKLLAKRPDDRYLTARGLTLDLERALGELEAGASPDFEPGADDRADWLRLPARTYGRERETAALLAAFERAVDGRVGVVLVSGPSGSGKSLLAREVRRPAVMRHGHFVQGKFTDGHAHSDALMASLGELTQQALAGRASDIAALSLAAAAKLGVGAAVVAEVIPEARALLGEPGAPAPVPGPEARNRFRQAVRDYVGLFAGPGRPLVICLDDVQWAAADALELIEWFVQPDGVRGLLVILTARADGADSDRVESTLERVARGGAEVTRLRLAPLDADACATLVSDATGAAPGDVAPLSALLADRTAGNPLAFVEMLQSLHDRGLLAFDHVAGAWRWDLDEISRRTIDDDLARVLGARVDRLTAPTRDALRVAACLGSRGDLRELAVGAGRPTADVDAALAEAEVEGLITRAVDRDAWSFVHDGVRQAVLDGVGGPQELHAAIARRLALGVEDGRATEVARQVVAGLPALLGGPWGERLALARAAVAAGEIWRRTMAFDAASEALSAAVGLLGDEGWTRAADETLGAHHMLGEATAFAGRRQAAEEIFAACLGRALSPLDRARIHRTRVVLANLAGDHRTALDAGRAGLALMGVDLPLNVGKGRVAVELVRSRWLLRGKGPDDLLSLPEVRSEEPRVALEILMDLAGPAYSHSEDLAGLVFLLMTNLTLKHGNSPVSSFAFVIYGMVVASGLGDVAAGVAFGRAAVRLAERYGDRRMLARARFNFAALLSHWQQDWTNNHGILEAALADATASGDVLHIAYVNSQRTMLAVLEGTPLATFAAMAREAEVQAMRADHRDGAFYFSASLRYIDHLTGSTGGRGSWSTDAESERAFFDRVEQSHFTPARMFTITLRMMAHVLAGEPGLAVDLAASADAQVHALNGQLMEVEHHVLRGVAAGDLLARSPRDSRARTMLRRSIERVARWNKRVPANFQGRLQLLEGLQARASGDLARARERIGASLAHARLRGEVQWQGVCAERLAALEATASSAAEERRQLLDAVAAYSEWGATAKVAWLREDHASLLHRGRAEVALSAGRVDPLDLSSVLKAAAALSSEIRLDRLLERIMEILVENVGARRGALLRERDGDLRVEVVATAEGGPRALGGAPLASVGWLAEGVIRFVARTGEALVLDDAALDPRFAADPHLRANPGTSVLCCALVNQGRQACVVYLENDLAEGAFSPERLRVVDLLNAQAAIALENARLYAEVEDMARSFERFVPKEFLSSLGRATVASVELGESVQKEMTVLFTDMRGFSALVEGQTPEQNIRFVNEFFGAMEPGILGHGGFVDSYLGDAIMALFDTDTADALSAGVEMLARLDAYNLLRAARGAEPVRIGIGVNSGILTLGTIGGPQRIKCGVIGDPVNLAARVESLTKTYRAALLTTDTTVERAAGRGRSFLVREVDRVRVFGRQAPVTLVEVFDGDPAALRDRKLATLDRWTLALDRYRARDFAAAAGHFSAVRHELPHDAVARIRHERCLAMRDAPPPDGWDGVVTLDRK